MRQHKKIVVTKLSEGSPQFASSFSAAAAIDSARSGDDAFGALLDDEEKNFATRLSAPLFSVVSCAVEPRRLVGPVGSAAAAAATGSRPCMRANSSLFICVEYLRGTGDAGTMLATEAERGRSKIAASEPRGRGTIGVVIPVHR